MDCTCAGSTTEEPSTAWGQVAGGGVWAAAVPRDHLGLWPCLARSAEYSGDASNPRTLPIFKGRPNFRKQFGVEKNWAGSCPRGCQMSPSASSALLRFWQANEHLFSLAQSRMPGQSSCWLSPSIPASKCHPSLSPLRLAWLPFSWFLLFPESRWLLSLHLQSSFSLVVSAGSRVF